MTGPFVFPLLNTEEVPSRSIMLHIDMTNSKGQGVLHVHLAVCSDQLQRVLVCIHIIDFTHALYTLSVVFYMWIYCNVQREKTQTDSVAGLLLLA